MSDHKAYMERRGIYEMVKTWGWKACTHYGNMAFRYPLFNEDGSPARVERLKIVGGSVKNLWDPPGSTDKPHYYLTPGVLEEIRRQGIVVFCEGEMDMLTLHTMGITNATTWFDGALSIPPTLVDDIKRWGAKKALYVPDMDLTGLRAALKFVDMCIGADIECMVYEVPGPPGVDLNDAYITSEFELGIEDLLAFTYKELQRRIEFLTPIERGVKDSVQAINPMALRELEEVAMTWGGKPTKVSNKPAIPILDPTGRHAKDSPGEHCYYFPESGNAMDFAYHEWIGGVQLCEAWGISEPFFLATSSPTNGHKAATSENPPAPDNFILSDIQILDSVQDNFAVDAKPPTVKVVRVPVPLLWYFGGFAKVLTEGKIFGWAAPSGDGKTIAVDTMTDILLGDGYNVLVWSGEWTPQEMGLRRIQRGGGASLTQVLEDQVARRLLADKKHIEGFATMPEGVKADSRATIAKQRRMIDAGQIGRMFNVNSRFSSWTLPATLANMQSEIQRLRRDGIDIDVVVWDYLQMATPEPEFRGTNMAEHNFELFKAFCINAGVVGIMTTQVTKTASSGADSGRDLQASDMQFVREDKFNLLCTAQRVTVGKIELPYMKVQVQKNSLGSKGYIYLRSETMASLKFNFSEYVKPKEVRMEIEQLQREQNEM